jgi:hypothetical protein
VDPNTSLVQFLTRFASDLTPSAGGEDIAEHQFIARQGEGSITLDNEDRRELASVINQLLKRYSCHDQLSRREVERIIHQAMFETADIREKRGGTIEDRAAVATKNAKASLSRTPEHHDWWLPVRGLDHSSLPHDFGGFGLTVLDDNVEAEFRKLAHERRDAADLHGLDNVFKYARKSPGWGREVIKTSVTAIDLEAGAELATRQATQVVDVLNYFADLIPNHHGRAYLPGWAAQERTVSLGLTAGGGVTSPHKRVGPLTGLSLTVLRQTEFLQGGIEAAETLLDVSRTRSEFDQTTVAALSWAGRATMARGLEEAFLLHAIALESLLLPETNPQELGYRLGLRAAFFLAEDSQSRRMIQQKIKKLYGVRSKIVHSGSYRVSMSEYQEMRVVAKRCIYRALVTETLRAELNNIQAGQWFEDQITR